jgi:hypothetical protein
LPIPVSGSDVMLGVAAVKSACLMTSPPANFLSADGPFGPLGVAAGGECVDEIAAALELAFSVARCSEKGERYHDGDK